MIIDAQIHIWAADRPDRPWPAAGAGGRTAETHRETPVTAAEALAAMDVAGVEGAVLIPPSWEGEYNDVVLDAVKAAPGRFWAMGRISDQASPDEIARIVRTPGLTGFRVILARTSAWIDRGADHPFWGVAAETGTPVMLATAGHTDIAAAIAQRHPGLRIALDHMGTGILRERFDPFADAEQVFELARRPNVSIKLTALPCYSREPRPWADVMAYVRRLYDLYGSQRLFWGSDLTRLPCAYAELVDFFLHGVPWLRGEARDNVMGDALRAWLQ